VKRKLRAWAHVQHIRIACSEHILLALSVFADSTGWCEFLARTGESTIDGSITLQTQQQNDCKVLGDEFAKRKRSHGSICNDSSTATAAIHHFWFL
jgi:hypothetical protein